MLKHPDITWVGEVANFRAVSEEILKLKPDTILFERTETGIPDVVKEIMVVEANDVRMIGLSLDNNEISLFQREHQAVEEASDLLQIVLGEFS